MANLGCIISIGSGFPLATTTPTPAAVALKRMAEEAKQTAELFSANWSKLAKYYRFNDNLRQQQQISECVRNMVGGRNLAQICTYSQTAFPQSTKMITNNSKSDVDPKRQIMFR